MAVGSKFANQELVVSNSKTSLRIHREVVAGRLRRLAQRLYTSNMADPPEDIVRRHMLDILAVIYPGCVICDRSAATPTWVVEGSVFLCLPKEARDLALPGVTVRPRVGAAALSTDIPLGVSGVFLASATRTLLENLHPSRGRAAVRRRLTKGELEEYLDRLLRVRGRSALESIADSVVYTAEALGYEQESQRALALTRDFLGTHEAGSAGPALSARRRGMPYDPIRLARFERLAEALRERPPVPMPVTPGSQSELPFFESYFSNYIEGTEFGVDEARAIVQTRQIPAARPADAHDILGVFEIVSNPTEMRRVPETYADLESLLIERHRQIMRGRPDKGPGEFKSQDNRAGMTIFVAHDLVKGTLREALSIGVGLVDPFARGVYIGAVISEVHPFNDGNGRIARIFANAELVTGTQERIIIPTAFRGNYLSALRGLSHSDTARPLIAVMEWAQRYTWKIDWGTYESALAGLRTSNAFMEEEEMEMSGKRLEMPSVADWRSNEA